MLVLDDKYRLNQLLILFAAGSFYGLAALLQLPTVHATNKEGFVEIYLHIFEVHTSTGQCWK